MIHFYYLEVKQYFKAGNGIEYQMADGGEPPRIYTMKKKAMQAANNVVMNSINNHGDTLILESKKNPAVKGNLHYSARLFNEKSGMRTEIRVTDWYTR